MQGSFILVSDKNLWYLIFPEPKLNRKKRPLRNLLSKILEVVVRIIRKCYGAIQKSISVISQPVKNGQFDQNPKFQVYHRIQGSNKVQKSSPQIFHVTLTFHLSHPKYNR